MHLSLDCVGISSRLKRNATKSNNKRLLFERPAASHHIKEQALYILVQWHECKSGFVEEKLK